MITKKQVQNPPSQHSDSSSDTEAAIDSSTFMNALCADFDLDSGLPSHSYPQNFPFHAFHEDHDVNSVLNDPLINDICSYMTEGADEPSKDLLIESPTLYSKSHTMDTMAPDQQPYVSAETSASDPPSVIAAPGMVGKKSLVPSAPIPATVAQSEEESDDQETASANPVANMAQVAATQQITTIPEGRGRCKVCGKAFKLAKRATTNTIRRCSPCTKVHGPADAYGKTVKEEEEEEDEEESVVVRGDFSTNTEDGTVLSSASRRSAELRRRYDEYLRDEASKQLPSTTMGAPLPTTQGQACSGKWVAGTGPPQHATDKDVDQAPNGTPLFFHGSNAAPALSNVNEALTWAVAQQTTRASEQLAACRHRAEYPRIFNYVKNAEVFLARKHNTLPENMDPQISQMTLDHIHILAKELFAALHHPARQCPLEMPQATRDCWNVGQDVFRHWVNKMLASQEQRMNMSTRCMLLATKIAELYIFGVPPSELTDNNLRTRTGVIIDMKLPFQQRFQNIVHSIKNYKIIAFYLCLGEGYGTALPCPRDFMDDLVRSPDFFPAEMRTLTIRYGAFVLYGHGGNHQLLSSYQYDNGGVIWGNSGIRICTAMEAANHWSTVKPLHCEALKASNTETAGAHLRDNSDKKGSIGVTMLEYGRGKMAKGTHATAASTTAPSTGVAGVAAVDNEASELDEDDENSNVFKTSTTGDKGSAVIDLGSAASQGESESEADAPPRKRLRVKSAGESTSV